MDIIVSHLRLHPQGVSKLINIVVELPARMVRPIQVKKDGRETIVEGKLSIPDGQLIRTIPTSFLTERI